MVSKKKVSCRHSKHITIASVSSTVTNKVGKATKKLRSTITTPQALQSISIYVATTLNLKLWYAIMTMYVRSYILIAYTELRLLCT